MLLVDDQTSKKQLFFELIQYLMREKNNLLSIINIPRSDIPPVTHVDYSARLAFT